ncbi:MULTISPECIES: FecR family protein [Sphingobacterium]|uniref:FecR family protein n=1 Tax=Sphingobacterium TaxID=28453 RepID=UPI00257F3167|nr:MULTISPECIES: FecR domain-containing protein [Sphingobacterium]
MKKIYNDSVDLLSDESFVSYHNGTPNKQEIHFWDTWIAENPDKLDLVADARKMLDTLKMHITETEYQVEKDKLFATLESKVPTKTRRLTTRWRWIAAASILLIGTFTFRQFFYKDSPQRTLAVNTVSAEQWLSVVAQNGKMVKVNLTDGSQITLMGGSKLKYPKHFRKDTMYVLLDGDARFNIAKKPDRTFAVKTGNTLVTVLGTQFLVEQADTKNTRVSLFSGKIKLTNQLNNKQALLSPGQQGYVTNQEIHLDKFTPTEINNFAEGILHFQNASFAEVARKMEQYYGIHISLSKPNARWRYSGHFEKLPVETALAAICFSKELSSKKIATDTYVLY